MEAMQLNDLTVGYGQKSILEHFDLIVDKNDLLVILGPSGCGKSTLLYSIAGLIKPCNGEIVFGGETMFSYKNNINIPAEKRQIGFVFQDYSLWPHMSVFENIAYPLRIRKQKKQSIDERVSNLLKSVKLSDKKNAFPSQLSGGEKQRVAIARAIASDPVLLLLDEPLANIDAALKTQLLSLISELKNELQIPMIYVTHDQKEAFEIASRMVIMESGKIIQEGCPKQIYKFPKNEFVAGFIGENNLLKSQCLFKQNCPYAPKDLLAVRPEDILISETGEYSGQIHKVIYKGSYYSLHVNLEDSYVIINVNSDQYQAGNIIRFDIQRMHVLHNR